METAEDMRAGFMANPQLVEEWGNITASASFKAVTAILLRAATQRAAGGNIAEHSALTERRAVRFSAEFALLRDLAKAHRMEVRTMGPDLQPWEHIGE